MKKFNIITVKNDKDFESFIKLFSESDCIWEKEIEKFKEDVFKAKSIITLLLASAENVEIWFMILIQSYSSTLLKDTAYIEEFYISKTHRSQWYWSQFFSYLRDYAKKNNISRIEWSTRCTNESAKNFYSKYGVDDKWIFYKMNMD